MPVKTRPTTPHIDLQFFIIQIFDIIAEIFVEQLDDKFLENHLLQTVILPNLTCFSDKISSLAHDKK